MSFKLDIWMEYDDSHHRHARWPLRWKLWMAVQVTTCRGRGHIVAAAWHAAHWLPSCQFDDSLVDNRLRFSSWVVTWQHTKHTTQKTR